MARGAFIEIVDNGASGQPGVKATAVRVNGADVGLIARGGLRLDVTDGEVTQVTLVLLPDRVEIKQEESGSGSVFVGRSRSGEEGVGGPRLPRPGTGALRRAAVLLVLVARRLSRGQGGRFS